MKRRTSIGVMSASSKEAPPSRLRKNCIMASSLHQGRGAAAAEAGGAIAVIGAAVLQRRAIAGDGDELCNNLRAAGGAAVNAIAGEIDGFGRRIDCAIDGRREIAVTGDR